MTEETPFIYYSHYVGMESDECKDGERKVRDLIGELKGLGGVDVLFEHHSDPPKFVVSRNTLGFPAGETQGFYFIKKYLRENLDRLKKERGKSRGGQDGN